MMFASMDGSLFEGVITARGIAGGERGGYRRVMVGNYVNDGILVDFTGDSDRWVGLYVGVNGRSLHIWDASTHDLIFNGGNMTDPDAYHGWHLLVDNVNQYIGRVEIVSQATKVIVVATRSRLCVMDMEHFTMLFDIPSHFLVMPFDDDHILCPTLSSCRNFASLVLKSGIAILIEIGTSTLQPHVRHFDASRILTPYRNINNESDEVDGADDNNDDDDDGVMCVNGAMNSRHLFLCCNGVIHVWEYRSCVHLYGLSNPTNIANVTDLVANDRFVACCSKDIEGIHLWDFSGY